MLPDRKVPAVALARNREPTCGLSAEECRTCAALPAHRRVGVNLERVGAVAADQARYFRISRERDRAGYDLTGLWAREQGACNALECDDTLPFTALELQFDDEGWVRGVRLGEWHQTAGAEVLSTGPDYVLVIGWIEEARA